MGKGPSAVGLSHALQNNSPDCFAPSLRSGRTFESHSFMTQKRHGPAGHAFFGAGGGTRTHTMSPPTDFESVTSTNSITPACNSVIIADRRWNCKDYFAIAAKSVTQNSKSRTTKWEKDVVQ